MKAKSYRYLILFQLFALAIDVFVNTFSLFFRASSTTVLALFILQAIALLVNILVMFLVFINTFAFKAGLAGLLFRKFNLTIATSLIYFGLTVGYDVYTAKQIWNTPYVDLWKGGYGTLFVIQRLGSACNFFLYKRMAFRLGDSRFYQDSDWLRRQLGR
eukprot:Colp12_sorted_trinity150504_noHs@28528